MIKLIRKFIRILLVILLIIAAANLTLGYLKYKNAVAQIPIDKKVAAIQNNEDFKTTDEISPDFTEAIVAIEDHRFYEHGAIDIIALIRATTVNLIKGEVEQGGSTITQQVAKNMYFTQNQTFIRKVAEMFVARDLEKKYSKEEILELYVNIVYYGDGNYGVTEASEKYFGKEPIQLTFDEATLLAGLPQAPSAYALSTNYERAKKRQSEVIKALEDYRK